MLLILFLSLLCMVMLFLSVLGEEGPSLHQWATLPSPHDGWKWQRLYVDTHRLVSGSRQSWLGASAAHLGTCK